MRKDEAVGTFEAAALLGGHFTKPARMLQKGEISARHIVGDDARKFMIYSRRECDENFAAYESSRKSGRPRTRVDDRPLAQKKLDAKGAVKIEYGDAIGASEAAKILGVWKTMVPRLAKSGKIVGRLLWSERSGDPRLWIFSRVSVEQRAAAVRRAEDAGEKRGRPRKKKAC